LRSWRTVALGRVLIIVMDTRRAMILLSPLAIDTSRKHSRPVNRPPVHSVYCRSSCSAVHASVINVPVCFPRIFPNTKTASSFPTTFIQITLPYFYLSHCYSIVWDKLYKWPTHLLLGMADRTAHSRRSV